MNKIIFLLTLLFLTGCKTIHKTDVVEVFIPVPIITKIETLEPFVSKSETLTKDDREDYEKVAKSYKDDYIILKKRNDIYEEKIKQHNGDN